MKILKTKSLIQARKQRNTAATALLTLEGLLQVRPPTLAMSLVA